MNELIEDLVSHGGNLNKVEVLNRKEDDGCGVYATEDIVENEILISVPFAKCFCIDTLIHGELKEIINDNPGLMNYPDEILAIGLIHSLNDTSSSWHKHIKTIPTVFTSTLYWTEDELKEVSRQSIFHLTVMMKRQIENDWNQMYMPLIAEYPTLFAGATLDQYIWALSVVYSRAVGFTRNERYVRAIPPVLDMANHSPDAGDEADNTFFYDNTKDSLNLICSKSKLKGEECYAIYGTYPNSKLAYSYGFVVHGNRFRAVDLWVKVPPTSSQCTRKQELLAAHPSCNQTYDFSGTLKDGWISPALLSTVRVIQLQSDDDWSRCEFAFPQDRTTTTLAEDVVAELSGNKDTKVVPKNTCQIVSVQNEAATYVALRGLLLSRLNVEQVMADREMLGDMLMIETSSTSPLFMALVIRVEEAEIIQSCLDLLDTWVGQLEEMGDQLVPYVPGV